MQGRGRRPIVIEEQFEEILHFLPGLLDAILVRFEGGEPPFLFLITLPVQSFDAVVRGLCFFLVNGLVRSGNAVGRAALWAEMFQLTHKVEMDILQVFRQILVF